MLIQTADITPTSLSSSEAYQCYCGLDSCLTLEVWQELGKTYQPPAIYNFEKALQAPYLELMQRGFKVDQLAREAAARDLRLRLESLQQQLDYFASAMWDKTFKWKDKSVHELNPRSTKQLQAFFYGAMRIPEIWISQKGVRVLSLGAEVLEKIEKDYLHARPFVRLIMAIREIGKQLDVLEKEIDLDGRWRSSYNIAGTETGRPSSSTSAFGTGSNAQNIAPGLRFVFCADAGYKLCVIDLEQVEARDVGFFIGCLFDDWQFLDNCESGDLHTNNCKLIWPGLAWTGITKQDKALAEQPFYRDFSFRDMAKRGGHLSNYFGTAWTASRHLKCPLEIMEEFQARYCRGGTIAGQAIEPAFPGIPKYWTWVADQLQTTHQLTTPFGRRRHFFGRPGDDATLREAIAYLPQSTTADRMNLGLWRVWKHEPRAKLLAQTHDSITFQYKESDNENDVIQSVMRLLEVELRAPNGRRYVVPGEAKIGWNWGRLHNPITPTGPRNRFNPEGLIKWNPAKPDERRRATGLARSSHC